MSSQMKAKKILQNFDFSKLFTKRQSLPSHKQNSKESKPEKEETKETTKKTPRSVRSRTNSLSSRGSKFGGAKQSSQSQQ